MQRVQALLQSEKPLVHLFYGDSITHGVSATGLHRDYTQHYHEFVRGGGLGRPLDSVVNTAISGNTTRALLDTFDVRVTRFRPDLVFLMIGMNDCCTSREVSLGEFTDNLHALAAKFRELGSLAVFQTTCPVVPHGDGAETREPHLPSYMQAVRDVAAKEQLPLVDHYHYWTHLSAFPYRWMQDAFHPSEKGHLAFARHLLREIGIEKAGHALFQVPYPVG